MKRIQVVLDPKLLQAADTAARRTKLNRSELIRNALREHLRSLEIQAREERDRVGQAKTPQDRFPDWELEAVWPEEFVKQ